MGYRYEARFRKELPAEEYERIISPVARRHLRRRDGLGTGSIDKMSKPDLIELAKRQKRVIESKQSPPKAHPVAVSSTGEMGHLAELFVTYQLRRRGFEVFLPSCPQSGTDLLVLSNGTFRRCEVKSSATCPALIQTGRTLARKTEGKGQRVPYKPGEVSTYILVDLINETIFVVPADAVAGVRTFTLAEGADAWPYKDRYDLL